MTDNLRIVQNLLRVVDPDDPRRLFLVIGGAHVRVLHHILASTPQGCSVAPPPHGVENLQTREDVVTLLSRLLSVMNTLLARKPARALPACRP